LRDPLLTQSYDYTLDQSRIATTPAHPRDHARLLVYNRQDRSITHTYFYTIMEHIPKQSALIFNNTKVIKARLYGKKSSGAHIELLINRPLDAYRIHCYIKGRMRVGHRLEFSEQIHAIVDALNSDGSRVVRFFFKQTPLRFESLLPHLETLGSIPLPPYINRDANADDASHYQSVFAKEQGAIAAPTASLHFTQPLFEAVTNAFTCDFVTLHVGAGTFKPVDVTHITKHPMHSEYFNIPKSTQQLLKSKQPLLAVGTTSTRTIEFFARTQQTSGEANLFLHPHNQPQRVNHLLTNFHLPKSTLLMLVASFTGLEEMHRIYQEAIAKEYRFYSYGDAMLIL